jgi:hypothetical protein
MKSSRTCGNFLRNYVSKHPAVVCPIRFQWTGTEEQSNQAATLVRVYAQLQLRAHPWLNFANLAEITFSDDYEQAVRDAAGSERTVRATTEVGGVGMAMTLYSPDGASIVLHGGLARALAESDSKYHGHARSTVLHELCHVSDETFKDNLAEQGAQVHPSDRLYSFFCAAAETMWDEYFANKYSHGSWSDAQVEMSLLKGTLPPLRRRMAQAVLEFRAHQQIEPLRRFAEDRVRFVAQCFGYAVGRLDALGVTLEQHAPEVVSQLNELGLLDAWNSAFVALEKLDAERSEWKDIGRLRELLPCCLEIMRVFGLRYRPSETGARIDVL